MAWLGKPRTNDDDLNSGDFCIVQLYHISNAGQKGMEATFFEHWDNPRHEYRGPIFSKDGKVCPDWDTLFYRPIYAINLTDEGYTKEQVLDGVFLRDMHSRWLKPLRQKVLNSVKEQKKETKRHLDNLSEEMTDYLWHEARKEEKPTISMTREERVKEWAKYETKTQKRKEELEQAAIPVPFKDVEK